MINTVFAFVRNVVMIDLTDYNCFISDLSIENQSLELPNKH